MSLSRIRVDSKWISSPRGIAVYLPPKYDAAAARPYPLLLLNDGQNLFDAERAHAGEAWGVAETADRLIRAGLVEPIVIVGIDHAGDARITEFTPTRGRRTDAGKADRYVRFLGDELVPLLAERYSIRRGAGTTGVGGSSLGALVSLYAAIREPDLFGRLLLMSPSVWWDRRVMLRMWTTQYLSNQTNLSNPNNLLTVWLDIGLKEGAKAVADVRRLRDVVRRSATMRYLEDPAGDHSERSWGRRFGSALEFLYPAG